MKRHIITLTLIAASASQLMAQGLHQEVEVEREITPVERQASRINLLPTVTLPAINNESLPLSNLMVTSAVNPSFSPLEPVASPTGLYSDDHRGYLHVGLFPLWNAELDAGYKFVDNDRTLLRARLVYDGDVYRKNIPSTDDRRYWRDNAVSISAGLHQAVGKESFIDANLGYGYSRYNMWNHATEAGTDLYGLYNQWVNNFDADVAFRSRHEGLSYSAKAGFDRFSYGLSDADGVGQNLFSLDLQGALQAGENSVAALGVKADLLHSAINGTSTNNGLLSLNPRYRFTSTGKTFTARVGLTVDIAFNDGKAFRIAPDVMAAWNPSSFFGIELKATGGSVVNTLSSLYDVTPYCLPTFYYGSSRIPLDLKSRIVIGPWHGAYIELNGGYARANDWLMPIDGFTPAGNGTFFTATDLKAWHAEARIGWDSRVVSVSASYATSPSSIDKAYYINRDRASHILDTRLAIRPVEKFEIEAGYSLRACRAIYGIEMYETGGIPVYSTFRRNLGNASDLRLSMRYDFTPSLTAFVKGENLLNRNYLWLGDRPAQGITGLVGINLKF